MRKTSADTVVVSDGRSEVARKQLRELFTTAVPSENFVELWMIYDMETSLHQDVRNPKRKQAFSGENLEVLFVALPTRNKSHQGLVPRDTFNKCGESTNFSRSYSGVPHRNLADIPRLTAAAKRNILGNSAVGDFGKIRVHKEITEKGHPLLWGEWKPHTFFSTLFRDLQVANVVDTTPGTGAAGLAALYSGIPYIGFGHNEAHRDWIKEILQKMFLAMVTKKDVVVDPDVFKDVGTYLKRSGEAAKLSLPKSESAFGDSFTGENDSDAEG